MADRRAGHSGCQLPISWALHKGWVKNPVGTFCLPIQIMYRLSAQAAQVRVGTVDERRRLSNAEPHPGAPMLEKIRDCAPRIASIIVGKDLQIRQSLTCLLAGGHLLIEDAPGVGKTTPAHAIAMSLGLPFRRIQFTSDLLPSDVIGVSVYDRNSGQFVFHPGPVFSEVLLADEINRASPKTQSALLEAMEEAQVSVDGLARPLPQPFFVIATQNPLHQIGTFPLPESQLDRFLMRIALGYPDAKAERELLRGAERRDLISQLQPALNAVQLTELPRAVPQMQVSDA